MAVVNKDIGTGVGSAGTGNVDTDGTTAVASGSVATAFTSELTAPGTIEIASVLYDITSITDDDNLVTVQTVPSGTNQLYNIGLRHYSEITLWEADDGGGDGAGNDDCTGSAYNDTVFDETFTINFNANSIVLTVPSAERHDGTQGTGARIVRTSSGSIITVSENPVTIEWLEIDGNGQTLNNILFFNFGDGTTNFAKNLIVHDATAGGACHGIEGRPAISTNCIVYNLNSSSGGAMGIGRPAATSGIVEIYNCTIHNITGSTTSDGIKFHDASTKKARNCISTDAIGGTDQSYNPSSPSNATMDHNLASDTTASGTGSLNSKSAANQFVSTTGGSEDLHLKLGADAIDVGVDLGTIPTDVNISIPTPGFADGYDRDVDPDGRAATWDMGADEFDSSSGTILPQAISSYYRVNA